MQQINQMLVSAQAQLNQALPTLFDRKRDKTWSESTEKLVTLLFTRFADLFGSKAASRGLVIFFDAEKNIRSETFDLWCRKLDDLCLEDFKQGMKNLETRTEFIYRDGEEMWPPSYAEFRALAFPKTDRDMLAHKPFERSLAIEDKTAREKRYELGKQKSSELLAMFGDEPEKTEVSSDHALAALEKAKQLLANKQNG